MRILGLFPAVRFSTPIQKHLSVDVEGYLVDCGDFEGPIPEGEYGGGTVMVWNRGLWSTESGVSHAAINQGELKLAVAGNKLRGNLFSLA